AELLATVARGELAPAERDRVLKRLASSPQGRARLALARDLAAYAGGKINPEPLPAPLPFRRQAALTARPAFRWAIAAGLLILLGGTGTWVFTRPRGEEGQIARQETAQERDSVSSEVTVPMTSAPPVGGPVNEESLPEGESRDRIAEEREPAPDRIAEEREPETLAGAEAETVFFTLSLLTRRDEGEPENIQIPGGQEHIAFRVDVTHEEFRSYDAVVRRGDEEISWERLEPKRIDGGRVLILDLHASDLPFGRYEVEVYGNSADGTQELVRAGEIEVAGGG
ncbi:MAG: hypothetical protein ACLGI9_17495, partial [Thermoanaerobaculia bacterium]